ncbi:MAG: hypothetical protein WCH86_05850 [Kiritimatiellales bacterium]
MFQLELIISVGAGLFLVGIGFVIIDYFLVNLLKRMYPQGAQTWNQMDVSNLTQKDQSRFGRVPAKYEEVTTHKMRKLGLTVLVFGLFILIGCGIWHLLFK